MHQLQTLETVIGILKRAPRKAILYLLIFVVAELAWIAVPFPRTDTVGNLMAVAFLVAAIALSSFLKQLPLKIRVINNIARTASWAIGLPIILLTFAVSMIGDAHFAKLFPYIMSTLLMVVFAMIICAIRTSRPDLMSKEEEEEKLAG